MAPSDVFRPRLPLDPFAALEHPEPWHVRLPTHPLTPPNVVLVLGAPSATDIAPLTTSPHLSHSLLILAAHTPPPLSTTSLSPTIIILHLPAPLAVHDAGALRLVSLLQRAQRVAHTWHSTRHSHPRILQLAEEYPGSEFTRHEAVELAVQVPPALTHRGHSPLNPSSVGDTDIEDTPSLSPTVSTSSATSPVPPVKLSSGTIKNVQIPFTALFNFLPPTLPDKALLKHAVLVNTLSAPFLNPTHTPTTSFSPYHPPQSIFSIHSSAPNLSAPSSKSRRRSRLSFLFSSSSSTATPSTSVESLSLANPIPKPHIVHVLPHSAFFPSSSCSFGAPTSTLYPPSNNHRRVSVRGVSDPGMGWASAATGMLNGSPRNSGSSLVQSVPHPRPHARKTKLVQSIEQFLLSHAYPLAVNLTSTSTDPSSSSVPSSTASSVCSSRISHSDSRPTSIYSLASVPDRSRLSQGQGRVVPFLLPVGVLGTVPVLPGSESIAGMSIGEMVVLGVLDGIAGGWKEKETDEEEDAIGWPRAWIGDGGDVVVVVSPPPPSSNRLGLPLAEVQGNSKGKSRNLNEAGLPTPPASSSSLDGGLSRRESESEEGSESRPSSSVSRCEEAWVGSKGEGKRKWSVDGKEKEKQGDRDGPGMFDAKNAEVKGLEKEGGKKEEKKLQLKSRMTKFFKLGRKAPLKIGVR